MKSESRRRVLFFRWGGKTSETTNPVCSDSRCGLRWSGHVLYIICAGDGYSRIRLRTSQNRLIRTQYANCCRKSEHAACRVIIAPSAQTVIRFRWYTAVKQYVLASVNRAMRMRSQKVCHRGYISCPAARNSSRCLMNNKREGSA